MKWNHQLKQKGLKNIGLLIYWLKKLFVKQVGIEWSSEGTKPKKLGSTVIEGKRVRAPYGIS